MDKKYWDNLAKQKKAEEKEHIEFLKKLEQHESMIYYCLHPEEWEKDTTIISAKDIENGKVQPPMLI